MDTRLQNQAKAPSATSVSPVQTGLFQPRPFTDSEQEAVEAIDSLHQSSNLQTQLEPTSRFGHNFSRVQVQTNTPSAIQTQLVNRQPEEQQDEEEANGVAEPLKMMAPPVGEPIEPESPEDSIQMMPHWGKLTPGIQRQDQEEEPIQMMPQLGVFAPVIQRQDEEEPIQMMPHLALLTPVIQRQEQEDEPIQMMPQWGMLQRSPQEEDDLPMQMMPQGGVIQRQELEGEEEPIQMKWLQAKLVVGAPGDKYEQEADSVAAQVMSMSVPASNPGLVQRQGEEEEEQEPLVQRTPLADSITPLVQRQSEEQEEAIQPKSLLQQAGAKSNSEAGSGLENKLSSSKGGGSPLPDEVRSFMEPRFGVDFSAVRVHTDSTAVQMNKELSAQAFAHGSDIYYGAGKSPAQDSLTAHELTHVVQQMGAKKLQQKPNTERQSCKASLSTKLNSAFDAAVQAKTNLSQQISNKAEVGAAKLNPYLPTLQMKCAACETEDLERNKPASDSLPNQEILQAKLSPALSVTSTSNSTIQAQPESNKDTLSNIQMKCAACEAEETVQPKAIAENITPYQDNKTVQKLDWDDVKNGASAGAQWVGDKASAGAQWVGDKAQQVASMGKDAFAALVAKVAPGVADLIRQGPLGLLTEKIKDGIKGWLSGITGNINIGSVIAGLKGSFAGVFNAVKGVAQGGISCQSFANSLKALQDLGHAFMENPAVKQIQAVFSKVSGIFSKVTNLVIAPAFDALMSIAGGVFNAVKGLATTIWAWGAPIRNTLGAAWDWVKQQLGIGGDGEGGVFGWLKTKASEAWTQIKGTLAPVMGPLKTVGGVLLAFSPVGQMYLIVKYVPKLVKAVEWLWAHKDDKEIVKNAHKEMGGTILPELLSAVQGFGQTMQSAVKSIVSQATQLGEAVLGLLGAVSGVPLLNMAQSLVQTVSNGVKDFITWCQEGFQATAKSVQELFTKIAAKVKPYMGVLTSLGLAIVNPPMIPMILAGWAWQALDDCYKAPIINFLLDIVIGVLQAAPSLVILGPLWPIVKTAVIGFLQGVRNQDDKKKISITNRLAQIISGGSPGFLMGFVKGLLKGIWEGVTDPFKLIYAAIEGLSSLVTWFENAASDAFALTPAVQGAAAGQGATAHAGASAQKAEQLPPDNKAEMGKRVQQMGGELQPSVNKVTTGFMPAVQEFFSGGEGITFNGLMQKLGAAWAGVQKAIQGAANQIAQKVFDFLLKPGADSEIGEGAGWVAGMFAFQALLDFFTAGTWTPVSAAGKALQAFAKFLNFPNKAMEEAFVVLKKLGSLVLDGIKGIGRVFERAGGAIKGVLGSLGEIGQKLIQFAEELLNKVRGIASKGGEAATEKAVTEGAEKLVTEGAEKAVTEGTEKAVTEGTEKAVTEGTEKTAQEAEEKALKEAEEKTAKEGGEQTAKETEGKTAQEAEEKAAKKEAELPAAIAEAKAITEANDIADTPAPILVGILTTTVKSQYSWIKGFEARPIQPGHYSIHMIASDHEIKKDYTDVKLGRLIGSGGNKNVYAVEGQEGTVIGVLKEGKPASAIEEEIKLIQELQSQGLSTVEVLGKTTHNGQPAIVMKEYAQGSKEIVKLEKGKIRTVGQSELLSEKSIEDLTKIRSIMESESVKIDDLQFLIGKDGSMVVADPLKVVVGESPSKNNLRMIDLLIEAARKNIK